MRTDGSRVIRWSPHHIILSTLTSENDAKIHSIVAFLSVLFMNEYRYQPNEPINIGETHFKYKEVCFEIMKKNDMPIIATQIVKITYDITPILN